ncbi:hypothetical protein PGB90_008612 [Kerria lacca]
MVSTNGARPSRVHLGLVSQTNASDMRSVSPASTRPVNPYLPDDPPAVVLPQCPTLVPKTNQILMTFIRPRGPHPLARPSPCWTWLPISLLPACCLTVGVAQFPPTRSPLWAQEGHTRIYVPRSRPHGLPEMRGTPPGPPYPGYPLLDVSTKKNKTWEKGENTHTRSPFSLPGTDRGVILSFLYPRSSRPSPDPNDFHSQSLLPSYAYQGPELKLHEFGRRKKASHCKSMLIDDYMDGYEEKLSDYLIVNILDKVSETSNMSAEVKRQTITMPSFIIKYKLKLPPAPPQDNAYTDEMNSLRVFHTRTLSKSYAHVRVKHRLAYRRSCLLSRRDGYDRNTRTIYADPSIRNLLGKTFDSHFHRHWSPSSILKVLVTRGVSSINLILRFVFFEKLRRRRNSHHMAYRRTYNLGFDERAPFHLIFRPWSQPVIINEKVRNDNIKFSFSFLARINILAGKNDATLFAKRDDYHNANRYGRINKYFTPTPRSFFSQINFENINQRFIEKTFLDKFVLVIARHFEVITERTNC